MWSLGCLLYEMTTLRHPFDAKSLQMLCHKIVRGVYPPVNSQYSRGLRDLIGKMLQKNPYERPYVQEILDHPTVKTRIQKFLSASVRKDEFSHTVLHGRPKPGDLLVKAARQGDKKKEKAKPRPVSAVNRDPTRVPANRVRSALPSMGGHVPRGPALQPKTPPKPKTPPRAAERRPAAKQPLQKYQALGRLANRDRSQPTPPSRERISYPRVAVPPEPLAGPPKQRQLSPLPANRPVVVKVPAKKAAPVRRAVAHRAVGGVIKKAPGKPAFMVSMEKRHKDLAQAKADRMDRKIRELAVRRRDEARRLENDRMRQEVKQLDDRPYSRGAQAKAVGDARRQAYADMRADALRNKRRVEEELNGGPPWQMEGPGKAATPSHLDRRKAEGAAAGPTAGGPGPAGAAPRSRQEVARKKQLENDRRAAELREFQRNNHKGYREAAKRNRAQILGHKAPPVLDIPMADPGAARRGGTAAARPPGATFPQEEILGVGAEAEAGGECLDMEISPLSGSESQSEGDSDSEVRRANAAKDSDLYQFHLRGRELKFQGDSVTEIVEELRMLLERELGAAAFVEVYNTMERLAPTDDDDLTVQRIIEVLGYEKVHFVPLIHQLIICEESIQGGCEG